MNWSKLSFNQQTQVRLLVEEYVATQISDFEIREKGSSQWMKVLSKLLFFVPEFMTRFTTTYYPKIYIPSRKRWEANNSISISILLHEYVHLCDHKRLSLVFNFFYLTPQILAVFALLFPYSPWFLLFLLCLLPFPSLGRAWAEWRGYRMSMAVYWWLNKQEYSTKFITHQFTSSNYYWMFPFRSIVERVFERELKKIKEDDIPTELRNIKNVLTSSVASVYNNLS